MKVALVCPYAWDRDGGVQTHVRNLAATLRERGHEAEVLAPFRGRFRAGPHIRPAGRALPVPANGSVAPLSFGPAAAVRVRRALADMKPDVLHLHEPLIPSTSLLALLESDVPAVGTFHAAAASSRGYKLARPVLERAAARLSVRTAVSEAARALIAAYLPGRYELTPNGVDAQRFAKAEPRDFGLGKSVLFLSRLERRKGLEVLIQAMTRLRDLDARLVVVGTGPEERSARALARNLGVPAEFLGRVHDDDLPGLYKGADVYCAPGLGGESFGIVLIEAMASGAPVVCSDLPGFRAVAASAARLVPPGEPGALADALRAVLTDDGLAREMARASERTANAFDWRRLVANVERLYRAAMAG